MFNMSKKISELKERSDKTSHLTLDEKALLENFIDDNQELLKTLSKM
ncbi:hypothetical protein [Methanosalsum natronophilum]|nr:hypothetical protein [Methanosalsum natronophilum]MCS3923227.1 hypothetical protein [Methanosalsum natronophilum]